MKWLILILLVSCGNKTPAAKDLFDSDGDDILNYQEEASGSDKFIADFTPLDNVTGKITFMDGNPEKTKVVYALSNYRDLKSTSLELMTRNEKGLKPEEHFSEWSRLRLKFESGAFQASDDFYRLYFDFTTALNATTSLAMVRGANVKVLGKWSDHAQLQFTKDEMKALLNGEAFLALRDELKEAKKLKISDRTYRVFYNDSQSAKVLYVSNDFSFESFLAKYGITDPRSINLDVLPFMPEEIGKTWWIRSLSNKDKVVVQATVEEMQLAFLEGFKKEKIVIARNNGVAQNTLNIEKKSDSLIFLKIRGHKFMNVIHERQENDQWCSGRQCDSIEDCTMYFRDVAAPVESSLEELYKELVVSSDGNIITLKNENAEVQKMTDQNGHYWEIMLRLPATKVSINLPSMPASTNITTGQYRYNCRYGGKPRRNAGYAITNLEAKFSLETEAYIEKLE